MITLPPYLKKGDTIGLVCPAGFMAAEKTETCINTLQEWGYKVKTGKTIGSNSATYFSGTDEERLADLQLMLDDDEVNAILFGRGGYGTGRIIDNISFKRFKKNPKWLIGYSDITVLHSHIYTNYYISTLHSPMAAAFNDGGNVNEYVLSLKEVLGGKKYSYNGPLNEFNRKGDEEGELVGGNLALLAHLAGSASDIKTKGRILFIEDIGEQQYNIDRMMRQLKRAGKLEKLNGLIFGIFADIKDTERPFGQPLHEMLWDIIKEYDYPVCFDFPVSHSDKNYALKIGVPHRLKVGEKKVLLEELS
jgi:muramoyltetrapeptide carboxypeptidase